MGRGSSSILQAQASAVAAIEFDYGLSVSTSEQTEVWETKEAVMRRNCAVTKESGEKRISITAKFKLKLGFIIAAALLVFGYGDGFSPSALAYSEQ